MIRFLFVRAAMLLLSSTAATAGAVAQAPVPTFSPRWTYEIKGGYFYPGLDDYGTFYEDDRDTFFAISGTYRLRDWLEVGAEIGHMRDRGFGVTAGSSDPSGAVELRLVPLHVFANFIYQPDPDRRFVPYAGIGLTATYYDENIERQPGRDGLSDIGGTLRAGIRWFITSEGSRAASSMRNRRYWRSYVFLEAQHAEANVDDIELGGTTYLLGYRVEFELGD